MEETCEELRDLTRPCDCVQALEVNCQDPWSTHTLSHVFEMTGQQDRGIQFLDSTVKDWEVGFVSMFLCFCCVCLFVCLFVCVCVCVCVSVSVCVHK